MFRVVGGKKPCCSEYSKESGLNLTMQDLYRYSRYRKFMVYNGSKSSDGLLIDLDDDDNGWICGVDFNVTEVDMFGLKDGVIYVYLKPSKSVPKKEKELSKKEKDPTNPSYYRGGIECFDVARQITEDLTGYEAICTFSVLKYIWRWKHKNGVEDLKKARWYLDKLISKQ